MENTDQANCEERPITVDNLKAMMEDTERNTTLSNVRLTIACLLGFVGFLRFDGLAKLRATDLTIDVEKLTLPLCRLSLSVDWPNDQPPASSTLMHGRTERFSQCLLHNYDTDIGLS